MLINLLYKYKRTIECGVKGKNGVPNCSISIKQSGAKILVTAQVKSVCSMYGSLPQVQTRRDRCGLGTRSRQIRLSLVPRLSQLSSTEKRGEPGIFSHVSMMQSENVQNEQAAIRLLFSRLHAQHLVYTTIALH